MKILHVQMSNSLLTFLIIIFLKTFACISPRKKLWRTLSQICFMGENDFVGAMKLDWTTLCSLLDTEPWEERYVWCVNCAFCVKLMYKYQWCGSALIVCESGSTKFGQYECGFDRIRIHITDKYYPLSNRGRHRNFFQNTECLLHRNKAVNINNYVRMVVK